MRNYKLYQKLIEKNNLLPEDKRRLSSVREEFKEKKLHNLNMQECVRNDLTSLNGQADYTSPNVTAYNMNNELAPLNDVSIPLNVNQSETIINSDEVRIDNIKIIGITGSHGKSTTAYLVHKYLQSIGKKSILYSSIMIDSPASYINVNEPCEVPVMSESSLLDILEEADYYDAEYVVIEVNESTIAKGLVNDISFTVRALTNISPHNNEEHYSPEEYVRIKESFFKNIPDDEESTCVIGLTGPFSREDFNRFVRLNNRPKITYGSKYVCEVRNADYTNIDCLLHGMNSTLNGSELSIRVKDKSYKFKTNVLFLYNAINFTCTIAILEVLKIFDYDKFNSCINNIVIPGREEVIRTNDRTIIIGLHLIPVLECLKPFKVSGEIKQIKVVTASIGTGFVNWGKEFSSELYMSKRPKIRKFAMDYLTQYADFAYITSNDNAAEDPHAIALELKEYINGKIPSTIVVDRKEAIKRAITESNPNDIIFISGRGNRKIFCDTATTIKLFRDREIVEEVIDGLGW